MKDFSQHPCFNAGVKNSFGRVHLPVAPKCNIQCNYCNRKYDCVNESRPGVTSHVLTPVQAVGYLKALVLKRPMLKVAGIAGPGDPFANPFETMETLRLINAEMPDMLLCVSSNGLEILPYVEELKEIGVSHVTLTINSMNPETLAKIYSWVRFNKKVYRGVEAGEVIITEQKKALRALAHAGLTVKINTILLPGINDNGITEVAQYVSENGAELMNCIPVIPTQGSEFENITEPSKEIVNTLRKEISDYIKPMTHCARCRADAAGLLGKDLSESFVLLETVANGNSVDVEQRPRVAVATYEGLLVNQHLGEAKELYIFEETRNGYRFVEQRKAPKSGGGDLRWTELVNKLKDCRAILVGGAGPTPVRILQDAGVKVIQMTGLIDTGLDAVYKGKILRTIKKEESFKCGMGCSGNAMGCA